MNYNPKPDLLASVEDILNLDKAMRFAAVIDLNGNILEGIMNENKTSLESQKQTEEFCKDKAVYNAIMESIHIIEDKSKTKTANAIPEIFLSSSFVGNLLPL